MTSRGAEKMKNDTIGVDVSKDHLDAHRLADGSTRRFANNKGGHKALIKWLAETPLHRVVFEPTGPYHRAVERALGASGVPFVKVNPRQARRFWQAGEDRSPGCGDSGPHGRIAGIGGAPSPKRGPARTEGALRRSRGPGEGSHRSQEPRKSSDPLAVEASECSAPRTDRSADGDSRSRNSPDCRSRREPLRSLRHPDQHSRRIQHHRLCLADRNAGARRPRSRTGRQPRRPGADRPTVRALDRSLIHSRRSRRRPPSPLHAGPRRRSLQSRHEAKYAHLIETGKPAKVALTAIMRKLVVLANALLKANRTWTPKIA